MLRNGRLFCHLIKKELDNGCGFVPLIGSGLSAGSGIPTGQEILDYLALCIYKALHIHWNPRKHRWPQLTERMEWADQVRWMKNSIDSVADPQGSDASDLHVSSVKLETVGALSNWRAALYFLSRLDVQNDRLFLGAPDNRVIDSFFISLTRNRRPNPGHIMLSHLATVMRIRTVLTTNFDTLIEDAFIQSQIPLTQFDVPRGVRLPDPSVVLSQRSIIKLHGGRYEFRADVSLDAPPSEDDITTFKGYFSAPGGEDSNPKIVRNHLMVIGSSGDDRRTLRLIERMLTDDADVKVFWICYSSATEQRLRTHFLDSIGERCATRLHIVVEHETELFLCELYQRLTLSLPPASTVYPAFWTVPPYAYAVRNPSRQELFGKYKADLGQTLDRMVASGGGSVAVYGERGVSSVASDVFQERSREHICVWLDLTRFYGEDHLFAIMTSAIAERLGVSLGVPITLGTQHQHRSDELAYYASKTRKRIIFFLNGRDGPDFLGGGSEATTYYDWELGAWYPECDNDLPQKAARFWQFIEGVQASNVVFVVLLKRSQDLPGADARLPERLHMPESCIDFDTDQVITDTLSWLRSSKRRKIQEKSRFVYALSLFRHAVHPAALCSWGLMKAPRQCRFDMEDNDRMRFRLGQTRLRKLIKSGALRECPGGLVWMHSEIRRGLQKGLDDTCGVLRAECHEGIADWYAKLFRSSNDPSAALESLRHRMYCVAHADSHEHRHRRGKALIEALSTLRGARQRILSCGYSRPFAALVKRIYDMCKSHNHMEHNRSTEFQKTCLDIQRDLYRELADFPETLRIIKEMRHFHRATNPPLPAHSALPQLVGPAVVLQGRATPMTGSPPALSVNELKYQEAIAYMGLRLYERSEKCFIDLFRTLLGPQVGTHGDSLELLKIDAIPSIGAMREIGRLWDDTGPSGETRRLMVRAIRRYMFLLMLKAQLVLLRDCPTEKGILTIAYRSQNRTYVALQQRAETFYCLATELMRYISDYGFIERENAFIRTNYGVLLGNMQRFHEAHRRLNEASAYLRHSSEPSDSIAWAILDLRRAEVQFTEACDLGATWMRRAEQVRSPYGWRQCIAIVNDAQMHLERAHSQMEGHRKNVWWWTWAYQLQISICALLSHLKTVVYFGNSKIQCSESQQTEGLGLICRSCQGKWKVCEDLFTESMRLTMLDPLRQARLIELFLFLLADKYSVANTSTPTKEDRTSFNSLWDHLFVVLNQRAQKGSVTDPLFLQYKEKLTQYVNHSRLSVINDYQ